MNKEQENQLKTEIKYIFESGANEIRIFEMVKTFIERRYLQSIETEQSVNNNDLYICGHPYYDIDNCKLNKECNQCKYAHISKGETDQESEETTVMTNIMNQIGYSPYCGEQNCRTGMPRTKYNNSLGQFVCSCGWVSKFPESFMKKYRKKWNIAPSKNF